MSSRIKSLFGKKDNTETPVATPVVKSDETTPVQSGVPSLMNEKVEGEATVEAPESRSHSQTEEAKEKVEEPQEDAEPDNAAEKKINALGPQESVDDESRYPKSTQFALITIALCLSVFCMALDNTIIATAIPKITDEFHAINDVGWYGS
jgi:hypothetical protein